MRGGFGGGFSNPDLGTRKPKQRHNTMTPNELYVILYICNEGMVGLLIGNEGNRP